MSDSTSTIVSRIPGRHTTSGQALRFVVLGCFNTGATIVGFYLLSGVVSPHVAFTVIYALGIAFVVLVTPGYVFGARAPWSRRALLGLVYVGSYVVGLGVMTGLRDVFDAPRIVVVLAPAAVTAPLSFIGARFLVGRQSTGGSTPSG